MGKRVLDITDIQSDFVLPGGSMYISGSQAERLPQKLDVFLQKLAPSAFDLALIKMDTHFLPFSGKSKAHCIYGTPGWEAAFNLSALQESAAFPVYIMLKDQNDMWALNPATKAETLVNETDLVALKNLFRVSSVCDKDWVSALDRDVFMEGAGIGIDTDVVCVGGAANYCFHDALLGYLKRGCRVIIPEDLVYGIKTNSNRLDRASSGNIRDVVKLEVFQPYRESKKIIFSTANNICQPIFMSQLSP